MFILPQKYGSNNQGDCFSFGYLNRECGAVLHRVRIPTKNAIIDQNAIVSSEGLFETQIWVQNHKPDVQDFLERFYGLVKQKMQPEDKVELDRIKKLADERRIASQTFERLEKELRLARETLAGSTEILRSALYNPNSSAENRLLSFSLEEALLMHH